MTARHIHLGDLFRSRREPGKAGFPVTSVTMYGGLVQRDTLDRKSNGNLTPEEHLLIRKGDIAYNMMRMWQGASGLAENDGIVSPAYVVVAPKDGIDPMFASYWFKSARMIHLFWAYSYGITGDRLRLYYKDFARIPVIVPPKPEQERIGRVLSTTDRAIAGVEKLIAAKRTLKKGLAQQLLTGQRRLPGFNKPWSKREFGQLASVSKKRFDPQNGENRRCIELEHISQGDGCLIRTIDSRGQQSMKAVFSKGDVLFGKLRPNLRKSYLCGFDGVCSTEIWVLLAQSSVCCSEYLAQLVQTERFVAAACITSGSKMPRADWGYVSEIPFDVPTVPEQTRIAAVLGAADREIVLLEKKFATLRELKKGLMQKLLNPGMKCG
ncbi:MAG: restriction endonuclease subunit S [Phycisphaerales bacterium]